MPTRALKPNASTIMSGRVREDPSELRRDHARRDQPDGDADEAASHRQSRRLDEELREHVPGLRADGHADADLTRTLGHADEHDVHDADAADDQ